MIRTAKRAFTAVFSTGMLGSAALATSPNVSDGAWHIDPARDPLYGSNRVPGRYSHATPSHEPDRRVDQDAPGGPNAPRGDCVDCTDMETEQDCGIPADTVNGGCNSDPPVFGSLRCGQEFCGTGATNGTIRDTDWWMFEIQHTTTVTLTVTADFAAHIGFGDLSNGCPIATLLVGEFGDGCNEIAITETLEPGTYVAFVAPQFSPTVPCGARYSGSMQCAVVCDCPGDFDADHAVSLSDLALFLSNFGVQPSDPCMDFDQDGVVALEDLSTFLPTFGSICP